MRIHNLLLTAAVSAFAVNAQAQTANSDALSATFGVGFESAYVFRGHEVTDNSLQSNVVVNYEGFYAGAFSYLPLQDRDVQLNELDYVLGYKLTEDKWTFDLGYTHYSYTDNVNASGYGINRSNEVKVAASYADIGGGVSPSVALYYDWNLEALTGEASVSKTFDLSKWVKSLSLSTSAYLGVTDSKDVDAGKAAGDQSNGYTYAGATANLVYGINDNFSLYVGPRISTTNDDVAGLTSPASEETLFWWGAGISGSF